MAGEVNVYLGEWTAVGTNASVPRWSLQVRFDWTDNAGAAHTDTRTLIFPNVLSGIPIQRLREYMQDIILKEARIQLGVDNG